MLSNLAGMTVILTREEGDNIALAARLRLMSADVIEIPCVRVEPLDDIRPLCAALAALREEDWVVLTSRNGAEAVARCRGWRAPVAAVGGATAERALAHGLRVEFAPTIATGEQLGRELPDCRGITLLARSDRALPGLPRILRERGFAVREVVAYRTVIGARGDLDRVRALLAAPERRVVVLFHSPSAVEGLLAAIDPRLVARASIRVAGAASLRAAREALGTDADVSLIEQEEAHVANH